jgi:hypothetical protein
MQFLTQKKSPLKRKNSVGIGCLLSRNYNKVTTCISFSLFSFVCSLRFALALKLFLVEKETYEIQKLIRG